MKKDMWKHEVSYAILEYFKEYYPDVVVVDTDQFSLHKNLEFCMFMLSREDIERSHQTMMNFLKYPIEQVCQHIVKDVERDSEVSEPKNGIGFRSILFQFLNIEEWEDGSIGPPYEGVKVTIAYFPRVIPVPNFSNGTLIIL